MPSPVPDEADPQPAAPSPFADDRGGPSTYSGLAYQTAFAAQQALTAVLSVLTDPSRALVLRLEPRSLVDGGQRGFDVGLDDSGARRRFEAKVKPSKTDVLEFVGGLPVVAEDDQLEVALVAGASGVWFDAVQALEANSREATNEAEFAALLEASGDARRQALAQSLGSNPWAAARRLGPPLLLPPDVLDNQMRQTAVLLAGESRAEELVLRCSARVAAAAKRRESINAAALAAELSAANLLRPVLAVPEHDEAAVRVIALLEMLGDPLPISVLAASIEESEEALLSILETQLKAGGIVQHGEKLSRPLSVIEVPSRYAADAPARALEQLNALARSQPAAAVEQSFNAYLLARALLDERPELVAETFYAFDKPVKGRGSLLLVAALAQLSLTAIARLAVRDGEFDRARLLWLRGHARICGTTWCHQRTGNFEQAAADMEASREEAVEFGHLDNVAFVDKCLGRISRLRGEVAGESAAHEEANRHYEVSVDQLKLAQTEFLTLLEMGYTRYADEPGECLSLVARTHLSAGNLEAAEEASRSAWKALAGTQRPSKAVGDQSLLDIEIALARAQGGIVASELPDVDELERSCRAVIADFPPVVPLRPEAGINVGESEIRARAQRLLAVLLSRKGEHQAAGEAWDAAAAEFRLVDQMSSAYDCHFLALEARSEFEPRLLAVLEERQASNATRVEAHRLFKSENGAERPDAFVRGLVAKAEALAKLRAHPFGDVAA